MVAALKLIKSKRIDILNENVRVCAMLSDIEPELRRERRRVKALYETGAVRLVASALAVSGKDEARVCLDEAAQVLIDEADMTYDAAAETVNYFSALWYGLPALKIDSSQSGRHARKGFAKELSGFGEVKPSSAFADSVSAVGAQQLADELVERYHELIKADGSKPAKAQRLCRLAMLLMPYSPHVSAGMFERAASFGGAEQLSLISRQILSWRGYLGYEPAFGFAMLKKGVDMGAKKGCFALGYCYHNAVGICRCKELAEKYYLLAESLEPDCRNISARYREQLSAGKEFDDGLWRFY